MKAFLLRNFGIWLGLLSLTFGVKVAWAEAPPIEVKKVAGWEVVSAGGELAYLIIITNTSSSPLNGITVRDVVPEHTTFLGTGSSGEGWWIATRTTEEGLEIFWQSKEPLPPHQAARLGFVVKTDATLEPIVSPACRVTVEGWDSPVFCNQVKTEVAPTTPTSTPASAPTETPAPFPSPPKTFTPLPYAPPETFTFLPPETLTASPTVKKPEPATPTPELTSTLPPTSTLMTPTVSPRPSVPQTAALVGGIILVAIMLIGSIWLLKRR